jgi:hypothetical protein
MKIELPAASLEEQVTKAGRLGASCRGLMLSPALLAGVVDDGEVETARAFVGVFILRRICEAFHGTVPDTDHTCTQPIFLSLIHSIQLSSKNASNLRM